MDGGSNMTFKEYIEILKRRKALFVSILAVSVIATFVATFFIVDPVYESSTTLMIGKARSAEESYIDYQSYEISQKLVNTYAQVAKSDTVIAATIKNLGLKTTPSELAESISVAQLEETEILKITVSSTNPKIPALVANELAKVFRLEIVRLLNDSNIHVVDVAKEPSVAAKPNRTINMAAGLFFGIMGGLFLVYMREYMDNKINSQLDIQKHVGLGVIGSIPKFKRSFDSIEGDLVMKYDPKSPESESFRSIRTNIQFANIDEKIKTILVTSAVQGEGKTTVAANMAVAFAGIGKNVVIIDCDFRNPTLGRIFGVSNNDGITDILLLKKPYEGYLKETWAENLQILTAGRSVQNPAEILQSDKMKELIESLKQKFDYVIVDTPPAVVVTDAIIASSFSDAVLLVCSAGNVSIDDAKRAKDVLEGVSAKLMGAVLNGIPKSEVSEYYKYPKSPERK